MLICSMLTRESVSSNLLLLLGASISVSSVTSLALAGVMEEEILLVSGELFINNTSLLTGPPSPSTLLAPT